MLQKTFMMTTSLSPIVLPVFGIVGFWTHDLSSRTLPSAHSSTITSVNFIDIQIPVTPVFLTSKVAPTKDP